MEKSSGEISKELWETFQVELLQISRVKFRKKSRRASGRNRRRNSSRILEEAITRKSLRKKTSHANLCKKYQERKF